MKKSLTNIFNAAIGLVGTLAAIDSGAALFAGIPSTTESLITAAAGLAGFTLFAMGYRRLIDSEDEFDTDDNDFTDRATTGRALKTATAFTIAGMLPNVYMSASNEIIRPLDIITSHPGEMIAYITTASIALSLVAPGYNRAALNNKINTPTSKIPQQNLRP